MGRTISNPKFSKQKWKIIVKFHYYFVLLCSASTRDETGKSQPAISIEQIKILCVDRNYYMLKWLLKQLKRCTVELLSLIETEVREILCTLMIDSMYIDSSQYRLILNNAL